MTLDEAARLVADAASIVDAVGAVLRSLGIEGLEPR